MNSKILLISILMSIFITACGGGNSSSDDNASVTASTEAATNDGVTTSFSRTTVRVGEEITINYNLDGSVTVGTIDWGDNRTDRISDSGSVTHIYSSAGAFDINIRLDDGSLIRLGTVRINSAESQAVTPTASESAAPRAPTTPTVLTIPSCTANFSSTTGNGQGLVNSISGTVQSSNGSNVSGLTITALFSCDNSPAPFPCSETAVTDVNGDFNAGGSSQFLARNGDQMPTAFFFIGNGDSFDSSGALCSS